MNTWEKLEKTNTEVENEQKNLEEVQKQFTKKNEELKNQQQEVKRMLGINCFSGFSGIDLKKISNNKLLLGGVLAGVLALHFFPFFSFLVGGYLAYWWMSST